MQFALGFLTCLGLLALAALVYLVRWWLRQRAGL